MSATCPTTSPCGCPSCGLAALLIRSTVNRRGVPLADTRRITLVPSPLAGGQPYAASVRVDGREVFRIVSKPDEALATDVLEDIERALRRSPC